MAVEHPERIARAAILDIVPLPYSMAREFATQYFHCEHRTNVTGKALPAGHFLPEEVPQETLAELLAFLA